MTQFRKFHVGWPVFLYFIREILPTFLIGTLVFLSIVVSFQVLRLIDFIIGRGVPFLVIVQLLFHSYHSLLTVAIPVAFLFAVMWGTSRANLDGEIIGMQVSGVSVFQIYAPVLIFSVLLAAFCAYASNYSVPRGNHRFEATLTRIGARTVIRNLKPRVFHEGFFDMVLFAEEISEVHDEMKRVFIYDERDPKYPYAITAKTAALRRNESQGLITLRLTDGSIHVDRKNPDAEQQKIDFDVYDINLTFRSGDDASYDRRIPSMTLPELRAWLATLEPHLNRHRRGVIDLHRRFSMAVCCIVFGAMGFFLSLSAKRSVGSSGVVFCLFVGVIYWLAYVLANAAAVSGWVAAWLGVWAPNLIFSLVPVFAYRRYRRGA